MPPSPKKFSPILLPLPRSLSLPSHTLFLPFQVSGVTFGLCSLGMYPSSCPVRWAAQRHCETGVRMAETSTENTSSVSLLLSRDGTGEDVTRSVTLALLFACEAGRRAPSMLVRETATRQLEERRADWGYSKPMVALDMMWNMDFVLVSIVMLIFTVRERPNTPIRIWICGYALQCGFHVVLLWLEYRWRRRRAGDEERESDSDTYDSEDDEVMDGSPARTWRRLRLWMVRR